MSDIFGNKNNKRLKKVKDLCNYEKLFPQTMPKLNKRFLL